MVTYMFGQIHNKKNLINEDTGKEVYLKLIETLTSRYLTNEQKRRSHDLSTNDMESLKNGISKQLESREKNKTNFRKNLDIPHDTV